MSIKTLQQQEHQPNNATSSQKSLKDKKKKKKQQSAAESSSNDFIEGLPENESNGSKSFVQSSVESVSFAVDMALQHRAYFLFTAAAFGIFLFGDNASV